jgi:hypothetical protein
MFSGNSVTLEINIKEGGVPLSPIDGAIGRFAIAFSPEDTPIFNRDSVTNRGVVYFTTDPEWRIVANISDGDTAGLNPQLYFYEFRLDAESSQQTIRSGWFFLRKSLFPSS